MESATTVRLKPEGGLVKAVDRVVVTSVLSGRGSVEASLNTSSTSVSTLLIRFRLDSLYQGKIISPFSAFSHSGSNHGHGAEGLT